jgi:hypothetical protein
MSLGMSDRQAKMAAGLGDGRRVTLDDADTKQKAVFTDEQVAASVGKVFEWVKTGQEPQPRDFGDGWLAVAAQLRITFASDAEPPAVNANQLAEVVRSTHIRAEGVTGYSVILPLAELPPEDFAGWRAAAIHGYNCVIADPEGIRETPLHERERMIVAQARQTLGG